MKLKRCLMIYLQMLSRDSLHLAKLELNKAKLRLTRKNMGMSIMMRKMIERKKKMMMIHTFIKLH
jgi:hypothetical protein